MLTVELLNHVSVRTLNHAAFRLLVLITATYNGKNNGALGITACQASEAGFSNRRTLYKSFHELEARGLVIRTYPASRIPPRPTMYAITWQSLDDTEHTKAATVPSHQYRAWTPAGNAS